MTSRLAVRGRRSVRGIDLLGFAVTVAFVIAALLIAAFAVRLPAKVDEVTIDNPHVWSARVEVTDADRDRWLGIGTVGRETERSFLDIGDQGEVWIFRFSYAGEAVELRVGRVQLEDDDWRVRVPDDFAETLRAAGIAEAPT